MLTGEIEQRTNIRIKKRVEFETYVNAIDVDFENDNGIFTRWLYKLNTTECFKINRSQ